MNRKLLLLALVFVGAPILWWILPDDIAFERSDQHKKKEVIDAGEGQIRSIAVTKPPSDISAVDGSVSSLKEHEEKELPEALAEKMGDIAKAYETSLRYPDYSQPITGKDSPYLQLNTYSIVNMPVLDGESSAVLVLEKYRFFYPEPIEVSVQSELAVNGMSISVIDTDSWDVVFSDSVSENFAVIQPEENWPNALRIKADISFQEGNDILTADFQYLKPSGEVTGIESPTPSGADYLIPVSVDIYEKGIYRLRANIYRKGGVPFAALNAKERLDEGPGLLYLKVHRSVLPEQETEFQLKDIQLERMSGYPGDKGGFGLSKKTSFDIQGIDTSKLTQESYVPSEKERQKLDFLRSMAGEH